jgi:hypothetical protein
MFLTGIRAADVRASEHLVKELYTKNSNFFTQFAKSYKAAVEANDDLRFLRENFAGSSSLFPLHLAYSAAANAGPKAVDSFMDAARAVVANETAGDQTAFAYALLEMKELALCDFAANNGKKLLLTNAKARSEFATRTVLCAAASHLYLYGTHVLEIIRNFPQDKYARLKLLLVAFQRKLTLSLGIECMSQDLDIVGENNPSIPTHDEYVNAWNYIQSSLDDELSEMLHMIRLSARQPNYKNLIDEEEVKRFAETFHSLSKEFLQKASVVAEPEPEEQEGEFYDVEGFDPKEAPGRITGTRAGGAKKRTRKGRRSSSKARKGRRSSSKARKGRRSSSKGGKGRK